MLVVTVVEEEPQKTKKISDIILKHMQRVMTVYVTLAKKRKKIKKVGNFADY